MVHWEVLCLLFTQQTNSECTLQNLRSYWKNTYNLNRSRTGLFFYVSRKQVYNTGGNLIFWLNVINLWKRKKDMGNNQPLQMLMPLMIFQFWECTISHLSFLITQINTNSRSHIPQRENTSFTCSRPQLPKYFPGKCKNPLVYTVWERWLSTYGRLLAALHSHYPPGHSS